MKAHAPPGNAKAARQGDFACESITPENSHEGGMPTSRNRQHRGFFRVSEEAIREISQSLDEPCDQRAAILAYVTMCRKVNLRGSETFEDTIRSIGADMAYGPREARSAVRLLEDLKLVRVQRRRIPGTKANAPSIYTVRTLLPNAPTLKRNTASLEREDASLGEDGLHSGSPEYSQELPQKFHTYIPLEERK
jgi:hypothetical protein